MAFGDFVVLLCSYSTDKELVYQEVCKMVVENNCHDCMFTYFVNTNKITIFVSDNNIKINVY